MSIKAFSRLAGSVLRCLGEDALLHSSGKSIACRVNIERGVQMTGYLQDATFLRDIATLDASLGAKGGDTVQLVETGEVLALDGILADSGKLVRFTVQPVV